MGNKEKMDFIKKVIAPYPVNTLLRMSVLKTQKPNIVTPEDYLKIKEECRENSKKNWYPEKAFQKAFYYVSQLTEERINHSFM